MALLLGALAACGDDSPAAPAPAIAPTIVSHPADTAVAVGTAAIFSVSATGSGTLTYQWSSSADGGGSYTAIEQATAASYSITPTDVAQSGLLLRVAVTNSAGSITSTGAQLTVTAAPVTPVVTTQPADATVTAPSAATFSAAASGEPAPTLRWQMSTDGGGTWGDIAGATSASYTTAATTTADSGKQFRVTFSNSAGSVASAAAILTVSAVPTTVVDAAGGTLTFFGGAVTMVFPAGAVNGPTTIGVEAKSQPAQTFPSPVNGAYVDMSPDGIVFNQPVTLTLKYDPAQLPAGSDAAGMHVGKVTSDGWMMFDSIVDTGAHTVSGKIGGFSSYGIIPGWQTPGFGSVAGMAARYYDWPAVSNTALKIATDTAGGVFITGYMSNGGSSPLTSSGAFIARLNADLSVQWLKTIPNCSCESNDLYLSIDQQGNAYVGYNANTVDQWSIQVIGFAPNGSVRNGFPVQWHSTGFSAIRGLAIDATGDLHVLGREANQSGGQLERVERGSYTIVRGGDGSTSFGPAVFSLPLGSGANSANVWALSLDYDGGVYVTSTWGSNTGGGGYVSSFQVASTVQRGGFPVANANPYSLGRGVNSQANAALQYVPVLGATQELTALNILTGAVRPGFPITLGTRSIVGSLVDQSGNAWIMGTIDPGDGTVKNWLGSVNGSGQMRSGFPRKYGGGASSYDYPLDFTIDPAGTAYSIGREDISTATTSVPEKVFLIRQPAQ